MVSEIFIENQRLDLSEDISALLTFALDDIKEFSYRNTTFSKTIVLPGTSRNNYLFGHIFDVRVNNSFNASGDNVATNFNPAVQANCLMFQNRVQIFKGTLRVLEIIIDNGIPEYEVSVVGEMGGLVSSIGAKRLEDLDFSAYDHIWNASGITDSWVATPGTGYYYPLVDYGDVSVDKIDYDIRAFRPALFVREYIDKIITGAGYRWESDLMETDRFKRLVVPNNQKEFQRRTSTILDVNRSVTYQVLNGTLNPGPSIAPPQYLKLPNGSLGSFTANGDFNEFTYTGSDPLTISLNLEFTGTFTGQLWTLHCKVEKNGTPVVDLGDVSSPHAAPVNFTRDLADYPIDIVTNDVIRIAFTLTNGGGVTNYQLDIDEGFLTIRTATPVWSNISVGETLNINDGIPRNILQKDFLSSIIRLFNLYVYEDNFTSKKIYLKPYVDFYDLNPSGVTDWNYKIDRSKVIRYRPMSELGARYYDFKFKSDNDYYNELYRKTYNESYGDRVFDSEFQLINDRESIEVIFSPSVLVGYTGADKIVSALYKLSNSVEERTATNIRIMQTMNVTGITSWSIKDGVTSIQSGLTNYGYGGHYNDPDAPADDIHFGVPNELYFELLTGAINVTQFNVYWSSYMAEITDKASRLMTASIKLNTADIFDLDFSKLKFVDGSYWRLNKIEDWNASDPDVCKVELLKVINLLY